MIYLTFCRSTAYFCAAGIAVRRLPCSDTGFCGTDANESRDIESKHFAPI